MIESTCRMCGITRRWSMSDWIAHRLANFATHFPWRGSRFIR